MLNLADLRSCAAPVTQVGQLRRPSGLPQLSARGAASALSGVVHLVVNQQGVSAMQSACAKLVLVDDWATYPRFSGDSGLRILAAVAEGVTLVAGRENTRSALAFWACETDPAVLHDVAIAA